MVYVIFSGGSVEAFDFFGDGQLGGGVAVVADHFKGRH